MINGEHDHTTRRSERRGIGRRWFLRLAGGSIPAAVLLTPDQANAVLAGDGVRPDSAARLPKSVVRITEVGPDTVMACDQDGRIFQAKPDGFPAGWRFRVGDWAVNKFDAVMGIHVLWPFIGSTSGNFTSLSRSADNTRLVVKGQTLTLTPETYFQPGSGSSRNPSRSPLTYHWLISEQPETLCVAVRLVS
jgi:hypothetical protein